MRTRTSPPSGLCRRAVTRMAARPSIRPANFFRFSAFGSWAVTPRKFLVAGAKSPPYIYPVLTFMATDGQNFLSEFKGFPPNSFEGRFFQTSARLDLGAVLSGSELIALYESAFYATLCNIAFNGLGGCGGKIKPEREFTRIRLERAFMAAREHFYRSAGWNALDPSQKRSLQRIFLSVFVAPDNLAW